MINRKSLSMSKLRRHVDYKHLILRLHEILQTVTKLFQIFSTFFVKVRTFKLTKIIKIFSCQCKFSLFYYSIVNCHLTTSCMHTPNIKSSHFYLFPLLLMLFYKSFIIFLNSSAVSSSNGFLPFKSNSPSST